MKNKQLTIFDAGVAFVLAFILAQFTSAIGISVTQFILELCGQTKSQATAFFDTPIGYLLQALYMNVAFVIVFILYYKRIKKQDIIAKPNENTVKYVIKCVILGVATLFLLSGVLNYFQLLVEKLGFTSSELPYKLNTPTNYMISLISLAVIPAVCEELIFRGVIVNSLKHKGHLFAIIFSSIMFSLFHFSPSQLIYPICFGLILAIVYLRTNNILFPILLHFINNALTLSIQYFSGSSGSTFTHSTFTLIYAIITLIIWIGLIIHLFKDWKQYSTSQNSTLTQEENSSQSDKTNNLVFYGSLSTMICVYILLLFL